MKTSIANMIEQKEFSCTFFQIKSPEIPLRTSLSAVAVISTGLVTLYSDAIDYRLIIGKPFFLQ
jgi:hypothetical protein